MAAPFTALEQDRIRDSLRAAAMRFAEQAGMRRTTVDQLAQEAGISKGAFYHFYESKELLFLDMQEHWYRSIVNRARQICESCTAMTPAERGRTMLRETILFMLQHPLSRFIRDDVPTLLRKLPQQILQDHFTSDDDFILGLLRLADIPLKVTEPVAAAIIKIMLMSIIYSDDIGKDYLPAMDAMTDCVCTQLIG